MVQDRRVLRHLWIHAEHKEGYPPVTTGCELVFPPVTCSVRPAPPPPPPSYLSVTCCCSLQDVLLSSPTVSISVRRSLLVRFTPVHESRQMKGKCAPCPGTHMRFERGAVRAQRRRDGISIPSRPTDSSGQSCHWVTV